LGKILIVNTGPAELERFSLHSTHRNADLDALLNKWAQAAAERLLEYRLNAVYSCPVPGADETAAIIASRLNLEARPLDGLSGVSGLTWEGMNHDLAAATDCPLSAADLEKTKVKLPFGDGFEVLREKVAVTLNRLSEKHKKETVAVISHRMLTVIMILHLLHMHNKHFFQIAQEAGAFNLFEMRAGVPSALFINDTCHLHGLI